MCALLASLRRIPIAPPGGSLPPLGGPANPSYSVTISDADAIAARANHDAEVEAKRLIPKNTPASALDGLGAGISALSAVLADPAAEMVATVTGRRGSTMSGKAAAAAREGVVGRRASVDVGRMSRDVMRNSSVVSRDGRWDGDVSDLERGVARTYGTVTYLGPPRS